MPSQGGIHERAVALFKDTHDPEQLLELVRDAVPNQRAEWCIKTVATELCFHLGEGRPRPIKPDWIFEAYVHSIKEHNVRNEYTPHILAFIRDAVLPVVFEWAHDPANSLATFDTVAPLLYFTAGGGRACIVTGLSCFFNHIEELSVPGLRWLSALLHLMSTTASHSMAGLVLRNEVIAAQTLTLLGRLESHVTLIVRWWVWLELEHTQAFWTDGILLFMTFSMELPLEHEAQALLYELLARACGHYPYLKAKVRLMLWNDMIKRHRFPHSSLPLVRVMTRDRPRLARKTLLAWREEVNVAGTATTAWTECLKGVLADYDADGHFTGTFVDRHGVTKRKRDAGDDDDAWVTRNFALVARMPTL